jgi:hypothetical protein
MKIVIFGSLSFAPSAFQKAIQFALNSSLNNFSFSLTSDTSRPNTGLLYFQKKLNIIKKLVNINRDTFAFIVKIPLLFTIDSMF